MRPLLAPPARGRTGRRLVQSLRVGIGRRMTAARSPHLRFGLIVAALAFLLDQFTKWVVIVPLSLATQPDGRISLAPVFDLQWAENCGISLSRSEEHTSDLQSLMRISYAVFCLKTKK